MKLDRWIDNAKEIASIAAPTFFEAARAQRVREMLMETGSVEVNLDQENNVFARVPGLEAKPLIISAHLDSVFPPETQLDIHRDGERINGPGIGDNAIALAALIEIAHDLVESKPVNDVWLIANVGEEGLGNLAGMRKVVERFGADVIAYLVLEGMALGHVYHRGLPIFRYRVSARTRGGHAWIHAGRGSAIHHICAIAADLSRITLPEQPRWSLNIGRIGGGGSINTIAPHAWFELDLRAEDAPSLERLDHEVRQAIRENKNLEIEVQVEQIGNRPFGELPAAHPLIRCARKALQDVGIHDIHLESGSTDASMPLSLGYPAICIGLTHGSGAHSLEEYIEITPLKLGYAALRKTMDACVSMG